MKTHRIKVLAILAVCSSILFIVQSMVVADEVTKHQKLVNLMLLLGVNEVFKEDHHLCIEQAEAYSPQVLHREQADYFGGITPSDSKWADIVATYEAYVSELCSAIDEQQFIELYATSYGKYVTEKELDTILQFFRSPIGKKDIQATKMARRLANMKILKRQMRVEKDAYKKYTKDLDRIISTHNRD